MTLLGLAGATAQVVAEVAFTTAPGATPTWTDISEYVRSFSTRRGRSSELDTFSAGSASLVLNNDDRRFDPVYASSPYYPNVLPMRRIRLRTTAATGTTVDLDGSAGCHVSTPDSAGLSPTAGIDLRIKAAVTDNTPGSEQTLMSKYGGSDGSRSWLWSILTSGKMLLRLSNDGTAVVSLDSGVATAIADGTPYWYRMDWRDSDDRLRFFIKQNDGDAWTQLHIDQTLSCAGIFDSTTAVSIGAFNSGASFRLVADVFKGEIRNAPDGTVVGSPDFTALAAGATSYTDAQGNVWTFNGTWTRGTTYTTYDLFSGYVDGWPQSYRNPKGSFVDVSATDAFKVLASISLPSPWEQEVRTDSPVLWWRLGDAGTTISAATGTRGGTVQGTASRHATGLIAGDDDAATALDGATSNYLKADSPITLGGTFSVECWVNTATDFSVNSAGYVFYTRSQSGFHTFNIFKTNSASAQTLDVGYNNATGSNTVVYRSTSTVFDGKTHHIVVTYTGSTTTLYIDGVAESLSLILGTAEAITFPSSEMYAAGVAAAGSAFEGTIDEVAVYSSVLSATRVLAHYNAGAAPWAGDASGARITRVLDEVDWPSADRDLDAGDSTLQYAVLDSSALSHMQDVALTEAGRLFVSNDGQVTFIERHAVITQTEYASSQATFGDSGSELRYSNITLDYSDTHIRNHVRVTSPALPARIAEDSTSQTAYLKRGYERRVLEASANRMQDAASYIVGRYKDPLLRVEAITIKPMGANAATLLPQVLGRELGERVTVKRRPQALGSAISQECHIESITHGVDASSQSWVTTWTLSPADTRTYWRLGHATAGKLGTTTRLAY